MNAKKIFSTGMLLYAGWFLANQILYWNTTPPGYFAATVVFLTGALPLGLNLLKRLRPDTIPKKPNRAQSLFTISSLLTHKMSMATLIGFLVIMHVKTCLWDLTIVDGPSMQPALTSGQWLWTRKAPRGLAWPKLDFPLGWPRWHLQNWQRNESLQIGDIIMIRLFLKNGSRHLIIKRIVALGGQSYQLDGNQIQVDGKWVDQGWQLASDPNQLHQASSLVDQVALPEYLFSPDNKNDTRRNSFLQFARQFGIGTGGRVPEGSLLVLGDNRFHSVDSRNFGFVLRSQVVGRCIDKRCL